MAVKYIPYYPDTIEGQAILDNFVRTRRMLKYRDNDRAVERIRRGMPLYEMETIETVGDVGARRALPLQNLLIRGECLSACAYLKEQGKTVDLVYIDPPFASGADYAKKVYIRQNNRRGDPAWSPNTSEEELQDDDLKAFEEKMYGDVWDKEKYLNWMYENLMAIKSVMSETASIYVHLDWHIGHYVKILMDEIFGEDNFRNEIIWRYRRWTASSDSFQKMHDCLY
jgi:adenine-specific DNA-methyltransferase